MAIKIVKGPVETDIKPVSEVSEGKYYALVSKYGEKGVITRETYGCGKYSARVLNSFTKENGWGSSFEGPTLVQCVNNIITHGKFSVYEFNTWEEMARFLLQHRHDKHMKQVVREDVPEQAVPLRECSVKRFYAFSDKDWKGFVTRELFDDGYFVARSFDDLTNGNGWSDLRRETLRGIIENLMNSGYKVFEFDNLNEFLKFFTK